MKITNISDLVINLQDLLDTVAISNESLFIQRPNDKSVIILSMDEFNKLKAKEYLLDKQQSNDNNP
ncbi:MAG: type II toxin-antitoxin system Phd/YefM family antitoxin [Prevotella sp.]